MNPSFRTSSLLVLILTVTLTACSSDYLDMSTSFRSELCVVQRNPDKSLSLLSDKGNELNPISELDSATYKPGSRYMVTYIVLDSTEQSLAAYLSRRYTISVKDIQLVLVKHIIRAEDLPAPIEGEDPIRMLSQPWLGGGFLNMEFMLRYQNEDIKHTWLMLIDSTRTENGSLKTYLTFIHNVNGDVQEKTTSTLVSFDCTNLPYREESDSLIIRIFEWDDNNLQFHRQLRIKNTEKL
jgi:hypothetical protein